MIKLLEIVSLIAAALFAGSLLILIVVYAGSHGSGRIAPITESHQAETNGRPVEASFWRRTTEDPVAFFTLWLMIFTAVLSGVAVVQLKFLSRGENIAEATAEAAKKSAEVSEKALKITQRAYLAIDIDGIKNFGANQIAGTTIRIKNTGNTPAYKVIHSVTIGLRPYPTPQNVVLAHGETLQTEGILQKGESFASDVTIARPLDPESFAKVQVGDAVRIYVWADITYFDAFDEEHFVKFCTIYHGPSIADNRPELCVVHNASN